MKRKPGKGTSFWRHTILKYESSEQGIEAFCSEHCLVSGTFKKWYYKLRDKKDSELLPVKLAAPVSQSTIGISLPNGTRLEFDSNVALDYAASLIKEVSKC